MHNNLTYPLQLVLAAFTDTALLFIFRSNSPTVRSAPVIHEVIALPKISTSIKIGHIIPNFIVQIIVDMV